MEKIVGTKRFEKLIDITDPCYDRDVWCRLNDVEIKPGEYECYIDEWDDEQTGGWGARVARIGIRLVGSDVRWFERIGNIGVDAGMAGFFNEKPDYDDETWDSMCDMLDRNDGTLYWIIDEGFFSNSGYGDGCYDVYVAKKDGDIVAVEIHFIVNEEDDDDEEWDDDEPEDDEE